MPYFWYGVLLGELLREITVALLRFLLVFTTDCEFVVINFHWNVFWFKLMHVQFHSEFVFTDLHLEIYKKKKNSIYHVYRQRLSKANEILFTIGGIFTCQGYLFKSRTHDINNANLQIASRPIKIMHQCI